MPSEGKVFKLTEVAEHNKSKGENKSIWIVIHDKVYDVTKFMDEVSNRVMPFKILSYLLFDVAASWR